MTDRQSSLQRMVRGCSRLLLWAGAAVLLFGEPFLHQIGHMNLMVSLTIGIPGGILVMLLGAGIAVASKSPKPEQNHD